MGTQNTKTIDDLGSQIYSNFEKSRKYLDPNLIKQSEEIASQTTIDVLEPIIFSKFQTLFDLETKRETWGQITPPPKYHEQKKGSLPTKLLLN